MFIARSIASGQLLKSANATDYVPMPELYDDARELYDKAYKKETYVRFCDRPGYFHGCKHPVNEKEFVHLRAKDRDRAIAKMRQQKRDATQFLHRADHDVESIYWVLVTTLLRVLPDGASPVADPKMYQEFWWSLAQHTIEKGKTTDSREGICSKGIKDWEAVLDPQLSSLSYMLSAMGKQIRPEYGLLEPLDPEHLHEAMRRLLLEQIVEMKGKPISLQRGVLRPAPSPPPQLSLKRRTLHQTSGSTSGSKKSKASLADDGLRPRRMIAQSHTIGE